MMCIYQVVHLLCTFLPEKAFFCTSQRKVDIVISLSSTFIRCDTPYTAWVSGSSMSMQASPH